MSIYNNNFKSGQLWLRSLDGNIQPSFNVLSSVYVKYQAVNQTFFEEITSNNLSRFDVFYDNILIETNTGYIFEKIFFDQTNNSFIPYQYNSNFNLNTYIPMDYWFDETNLKVYIAEIKAGIQPTGSFDFYVVIKQYDCVNGVINQIFNSNIVIPLNSPDSWGGDFSNIKAPKICYNPDTKRYNVSFVFRNNSNTFALMSLNFSNNEQFTLLEINGLIPFAKGFGQYTVTNLI
jgi:hypothetical protein